MVQKISAPVSVALVFNHRCRSVVPRWVIWEGQTHKVIRLGFHYSYRGGRTLMHVFSVESATLYFKLVLNTETLFWTVEEIADGEAD
ncbi:MAG: hypothetical protein A2782_01885 [Candidatus Blackburnbacteria bacterium RIFCSPHIGHO2_01_FULL_43_15b]|uniref:Uncharacterized protein n=1 Tax=Candidatus Blackburnbacteria bacterium RIFCSPHIGHO2_01_FULL_43_15b TaxID=1797513 RepID=A0A1G1V1H2_9BACT|nr:MAG: hypothetical protein A2782_01885 [Candidatus Blackburnbacteria bacterium RIFCSPHIGHO2_01_FULL_43_15b]